MRAAEFGMVEWVSMMAVGVERVAVLMRRIKSLSRVVEVCPSVARAW